MEVVKRKRGRPRGAGKKPQPDQPSDEGQEADKHRIRPRHEVWDLEAQVEQHQATVAQLEAANKILQRRLEMLNASVRVREDQVERFRLFSGMLTAAPVGPQPELLWVSALAASHSDSAGIRTASSVLSLSPQNCSSGEPSALEPAVLSLNAGHIRPPQATTDKNCQSNLQGSVPGNVPGNVLPGSCPDKALWLTGQGSRLAPSLPGSSAGDSTLQFILQGLPQFNQDRAAHGACVEQEVNRNQIEQGAGSGFNHSSNVNQEVHLLLAANSKQLIEIYSTTCTRMSKLLYTAEDSGPQATAAQNEIRDFVQLQMRPMGGIIKVCNPAVIGSASQPVNEGQGPAPEAHWEGVAAAVLFTPQQIEDVCTLNELQLEWRARIEKEQANVSFMLEEVLKEAEQHWKVHWAEGQVRKAEMMSKMHKVVGSHRWLVILIDELLMATLITPIQVARVIVHSYPWIPDAVALVQAVARKATAKKA